MFAPVYYPQPVYAQTGFVFTPSISIVGSAVTSNLFVQASTNQYLFGDFYAQNYASVGIVPWFSFSFVVGRPAYYDPLFSYYSVVNVRQNPRWIVQVREAYVLRRDNVAMRPPRTYVEQVRLIERNVSITRNITVVDHRTMAMPLHRLAADPIAGKNLRMVRVNEAERQQLRQQVAELHQFREQRLQQEREAARSGMPNRPRTMNADIRRSRPIRRRTPRDTPEASPPIIPVEPAAPGRRRPSGAPGRESPGNGGSRNPARGRGRGPPRRSPRDVPPVPPWPSADPRWGPTAGAARSAARPGRPRPNEPEKRERRRDP